MPPSLPKCLVAMTEAFRTRAAVPESPNGFTSSRRITCCRTWKAPACPRRWGWAQDALLSGRGSRGGASRSTPWSPATQKELLSQREPAQVLHARFGGKRRANQPFNGLLNDPDGQPRTAPAPSWAKGRPALASVALQRPRPLELTLARPDWAETPPRMRR